MSPQPGTFPLALARKAADFVLAALVPCCCQIAIAGSVRRQKDYCRDVDIVVWPKVETVQEPTLFNDGETIVRPVIFLDYLDEMDWYHTSTATPKIIHLDKFAIGELGKIPIELYLTEYDGSNYQALLQMRTGCAEFNQSLAIRAQKMGMQYKAGYGIFRGGQRVDDGTEDGIFKALGIEPIPPERRIGDFHQCAKGAWK